MKILIKGLLPVIEYLCTLSGEEVEEEIMKLKSGAVRCFIDIIYNVKCARIRVNDDIVAKLKTHEKEIQSVIKKRKSLKVRKAELAKIFIKIFPVLLPVLRRLINK